MITSPYLRFASSIWTIALLLQVIGYKVAAVPVVNSPDLTKRQHWSTGLGPGGKRSFEDAQNVDKNEEKNYNTESLRLLLKGLFCQKLDIDSDGKVGEKRQHWSTGLKPGGKRSGYVPDDLEAKSLLSVLSNYADWFKYKHIHGDDGSFHIPGNRELLFVPTEYEYLSRFLPSVADDDENRKANNEQQGKWKRSLDDFIKMM